MHLSQDTNLLAVMKQRRLMRCLCHRNCFAVDICHSQSFGGSTVHLSWSQGFLNPTETCCRTFQTGESIRHKSFACPFRHGQTSMSLARFNSVLPLYRMPINSSTPVPLRDPNYTCKAIPEQAWTCLENSWRLRLPDFMTIGTGRWLCCQPTHRLSLPTRKCSWYLFLLEAESTTGP